MARYKMALSIGLAMILVAACERPSAVAQKDEANAPAEWREFASAESPRSNDQAQEPFRELDGKPIWSASRQASRSDGARTNTE